MKKERVLQRTAEIEREVIELLDYVEQMQKSGEFFRGQADSLNALSLAACRLGALLWVLNAHLSPQGARKRACEMVFEIMWPPGYQPEVDVEREANDGC